MPPSDSTVTHDPARSRARYFYPERGYGRPLSSVEPHVFLDELDRAFAPDAATGFIAMDRGAQLEADYPATTPALLAGYVVLRRGDAFDMRFESSGEVYYVLEGSGQTNVGSENFAWNAGDSFALPGGISAEFRAAVDAVLFVCSDEPTYRILGARSSPGSRAETPVTVFDGSLIDAELSDIHNERNNAEATGKAVILYTDPFEPVLHTTPSILASVNSLEAGGDQRPHKHAAAALTLCLSGRGTYSMVGDQRIDWTIGAVLLTPPLMPHSHHNAGSELMKSFVVQDSGLHARMRTSNFSFVDAQ